MKFTLQTHVKAGLARSPPDLRALGEAVVAGRIDTLDEEAVALVLGKPEETEPALAALASTDPARALTLALRVLPLTLRFAMINGSVARVLDRAGHKPSVHLPPPLFWVALRRAFDATPLARPEALKDALAREVDDVRVRSALAFVFPEHRAFFDENVSSEAPADADLLMLAHLRDVPEVAKFTTWPPPAKVLARVGDAQLDALSTLAKNDALDRERAHRLEVQRAQEDVKPLLREVFDSLDVLGVLEPSYPLLEQLTGYAPPADEASRTVVTSFIAGWARELAWDGPPRTAPWRSPWVDRVSRESSTRVMPVGPQITPGRWERTFKPSPVHPQLEAVWKRLEGRDDIDAWDLAAILPLGPRLLPKVRKMARTQPALLVATQDIDDGGLDEAMVLAWNSKRRQLALAAREFARRFPLRASEAAVRLCFSELPAERLVGVIVLRALDSFAERTLKTLSDEQRGWIDALRSEKTELPARAPKRSKFVRLPALPPVVTRDSTQSLDDDAILELLAVLKALPENDSSPLRAATVGLDEGSLGAFAGTLFRQWLSAGAPAKDKWALHALAHLPSDEWAVVLGSLSQKWSSARAQEAVTVLGRMGTLVALGEVLRLSSGTRAPALRARARMVFDEAAQRLQLTPFELEDRLFPADAKRAAKMGRHTTARLERLMSEGAPPSGLHFTETWGMHPVLREIAERVVWGAFRGHRRIALFVPGHSESVALDETVQVRPIHPIELTVAEREQWKKAVNGAPFPQLEREVFGFDTLESGTRKLVDREVPVTSVLALERLGWERGPVLESGASHSLTRRGDGWSASLALEPGIPARDPLAWPVQLIVDIGIESTLPLTLRIASELQRDLNSLSPQGEG